MINEVNLLRFTAIFLMMVVHVPHLQAYLTSSFDSVASVVVTAGQYGFGRISAPLIGLVSGYFCVAMIASRGPGGFVARKARTLLVPLLFWNLVGIGVLVLLYFATRGDYYDTVWTTGPGAAIGLLDQPVNYPLYYLADLFKCCLIFASVHVAARGLGFSGRSYAWLLAGVGVAVSLAIDYVTIFHPDSPFAVHVQGLRLSFRPDLALFFFLGAALAAGGTALTDLFEIARRRVGWPALAGLFALIVVLAVMSVGIDGRYGTASVPAIGFDVMKRFVGSAFLLALIARLTAAGLAFQVSNQLAFRMFCTHVIFYQVFTTVGVRPNTGPEAVAYLLAYPIAATLLAWASLEAQTRLTRVLAPGPLRRMIRAIP
jgi:hypothetical protein